MGWWSWKLKELIMLIHFILLNIWRNFADCIRLDWPLPIELEQGISSSLDCWEPPLQLSMNYNNLALSPKINKNLIMDSISLNESNQPRPSMNIHTDHQLNINNHSNIFEYLLVLQHMFHKANNKIAAFVCLFTVRRRIKIEFLIFWNEDMNKNQASCLICLSNSWINGSLRV